MSQPFLVTNEDGQFLVCYDWALQGWATVGVNVTVCAGVLGLQPDPPAPAALLPFGLAVYGQGFASGDEWERTLPHPSGRRIQPVSRARTHNSSAHALTGSEAPYHFPDFVMEIIALHSLLLRAGA